MVNQLRMARARHIRMTQTLDDAIENILGLSPGDWDDSERSRTADFLRNTAHTNNETLATAALVNEVCAWLMEKYNLVDIRDTGWPDIHTTDNS